MTVFIGTRALAGYGVGWMHGVSRVGLRAHPRSVSGRMWRPARHSSNHFLFLSNIPNKSSDTFIYLLTRLSQLAVKHPSNGRISGGVVPQGRHHRMDGDYAIGMPSVVILGGGWSGKLILSR